MDATGYSLMHIDSVYLTGGSSLSLSVRKIIYKLFGKEKSVREIHFVV